MKSIGEALPTIVVKSTTSGTVRKSCSTSRVTASVDSSVAPSGRSITTCSSFLLSNGSIFSGTSPVSARATEKTKRPAMTSNNVRARFFEASRGSTMRRYTLYVRVAVTSYAFSSPLPSFSSLLESHGVIASATSSELSIVSGTLSAIGAMYGPIIPLMKNIGMNDTMIESVASRIGGMTSSIASATACSRGYFFIERYREMFSTPTIGLSTSRPSARISANSVTRLIV
ncbi:MAG: hypothetical protein BWY52_03008 [Chloroflexi bacterium ADurb.Bin325]|nr:MAG: hypothetical protein BWY52_03008 [Chloroflexi bacterium ADurb.Bin325]